MPPKRGPGRPTDDPRVHTVTVRLTDGEHEALKLIQERDGLASLSDALRSLIPALKLGPRPR